MKRGREDPAIYAPPWNEWIGDELDVERWEWIRPLYRRYGPRNPEEYERAIKAWEDSIEGGGLWDVGQELATIARARKEARLIDERTVRWVERHSVYLSKRALEVFSLATFGLSLGMIASELEIKVSTVRGYIRRIRKKARMRNGHS